MQITEVPTQHFGPLYSTVKLMHQFWQNMVWATFRATFWATFWATF
jgi:hypothetical protein